MWRNSAAFISSQTRKSVQVPPPTPHPQPSGCFPHFSSGQSYCGYLVAVQQRPSAHALCYSINLAMKTWLRPVQCSDVPGISKRACLRLLICSCYSSPSLRECTHVYNDLLRSANTLLTALGLKPWKCMRSILCSLVTTGRSSLSSAEPSSTCCWFFVLHSGSQRRRHPFPFFPCCSFPQSLSGVQLLTTNGGGQKAEGLLSCLKLSLCSCRFAATCSRCAIYRPNTITARLLAVIRMLSEALDLMDKIFSLSFS